MSSATGILIVGLAVIASLVVLTVAKMACDTRVVVAKIEAESWKKEID